MIWPTCLASADEMTGLSGGWIVAFGVPVTPGDNCELPFAFVARHLAGSRDTGRYRECDRDRH